MTVIQRAFVQAIVAVAADADYDTAIHGDCIGADAEFDRLAVHYGYPFSIANVLRYPGKVRDRDRAFTGPEAAPPAPPLDRNHRIVDESHVMVAAPSTQHEVLRSGTWATIRYARSQGRPLYVVFPNGRVSVENGGFGGE